MGRFLFIILMVGCILIPMVIPGEATHSNKNHDLLRRLGLMKVRGPNGHHRKRLAVESRHHGRADDSHMFVVKLPPNPYYYTHNLPNAFGDHSQKIPVGFKSNGKPAKVYHWNIPVLKKIAAANNKSRLNDVDINNPNVWNEVLDKPEKPHKPSYYVPAKPKKSSILKYFPGNGKPKAFYVLEKSRKRQYHRLLP